MFEYQGCTAIACVRITKHRPTYAGYLIEENCRYAQLGQCPHKGSKNAVQRVEPQAQESNGVAATG